MSVTYFVALPFVCTEEGDLAPGEAVECRSPQDSIRRVRVLANTSAGSVAFVRTGDPSTGEFTDAEVLATFGEVLSAEELLAAD